MSITTNFISGSSDLGTLFCNLTENQSIGGVKTFTSIPVISATINTSDNSTNIATTKFVKDQGYLTSISSLNASVLFGAIPSAVTATTQLSSDNSTAIATTAFVKNQSYLTSSSSLSASNLTGAIPSSVTATTQTSGDNTGNIATTQFVKNQGYLTSSSIITSVYNISCDASGTTTKTFKSGYNISSNLNVTLGSIAIPSIGTVEGYTITILSNRNIAAILVMNDLGGVSNNAQSNTQYYRSSDTQCCFYFTDSAGNNIAITRNFTLSLVIFTY